jgi:hypothetical protein
MEAIIWNKLIKNFRLKDFNGSAKIVNLSPCLARQGKSCPFLLLASLAPTIGRSLLPLCRHLACRRSRWVSFYWLFYFV